MRKLLLTFAILMSIASSALLVKAENSSGVFLTAEKGSAECNRTEYIDLVVKGSGITDMYTVWLDLKYDPERLELDAKDISNLAWPNAESSYTGVELDALSGRLRVIYSRTGKQSGQSGDFSIMRLRFKSKIIGKTYVDIENAEVVDSTGKNITLSAKQGLEVNVLPNPLNIKLQGIEGNDGWYTSGVRVKIDDMDSKDIRYLLDGVEGTYTGPFSVGNPGLHSLVVTTDDGYGYIKEKEVQFKIDNIKPSASLAASAAEWQNTAVTLEPRFADEGGSQLKNSWYAWSNLTETPVEWISYTGIHPVQQQEGIWYLHLKAEDGAGNVVVFHYGPYGIDKIPPELSAGPTDRGWDNTDVKVTPMYSDRGGSNIKDVMFAWKTSPDVSGDWNSYSSGDIVQPEDGIWYLDIKAEDNAGNVIIQNYGPYRIDKKAPVLSAEPPGSEWTNSDIEIIPYYTDQNGSGIKSLKYAWGNSQETPDSWNDYTSNSLVIQQQGVWYLYIKAEDNVGNVGIYSFGPYKIDKTPPSELAVPTDRDWSNTDVSVTPQFADEGGSEIKNMMYSWSTSQENAGTWNTYTAGDLIRMEEGLWYLHLKVEDNAGNITTGSYGPYRVDKSAPAVTDTFADEYTYLDSLYLDFTAEDILSGVQTRQITVNGIEYAVGSSVILDHPGANSIAMTAVDNAGNQVTVVKQIKVVVQPVIDANPDTVNLKGQGSGMVTIYIEFPRGVDVNDIIHGSIRLNGVYAPVSDPKYGYVKNPVDDYDGDGKLEYMIKFSREDIGQELANSGGNISITGSAGTYEFRGMDSVRVIN